MAEPPKKKAKKEETYLMNINNAMDKAWEGETLTDIAQAPISALQGLAGWTDEEFSKLGLSCIEELGTWKFYLWARALCKLAETEIPDKRESSSRLNVNNALDKAHEGKHLKDILKLPPSALQGLAAWVDPVLAKLHIKTIEQLGTWKYAEWANSIALLMPLEKELKVPVAPEAAAPAAEKPAAEAAAAAPAAPLAAAAPDAPAVASTNATKFQADEAAVAFASEHGLDSPDVLTHFKLAFVDIEKNSDKYFIMQTLKCGDRYLFCSHWGRTGTKGSVKVDGPFESAEEASSLLSAKFKDKSGNDVSSVAAGTFEHKEGKYDLVKGDDGAKRSTAGANGGCLWQYYVDDGVDGKRKGWYDYFKEAAEIVEGAYSEFVSNPDRNFKVRSVQSGTFCYQVDFGEMKQTNVTHPNRTQRQIRRNA